MVFENNKVSLLYPAEQVSSNLPLLSIIAKNEPTPNEYESSNDKPILISEINKINVPITENNNENITEKITNKE